MKKLCSLLMTGLLPILLSAQTPTPQWRPVYHFTPAKNWTNDPNGLIYLNGLYHLYYQHNPFENKWGHMSWGHATSKDLLHWKHLPVAIPEKVTKDTVTAIFSGSAVLDKDNTSGFGKGALIAIYTADLPKQQKEAQYIAYSTDGGLTYKNYAGNPVVDIQKKDFRDPSVIWHDGKWLMTVAVPHEHKVQFYSSPDLKKWELLSEFGDQGDIRKIWECPSLTPLYVDGDKSKKKWLLLLSSGNPDAETGMQYFTGDFDGKTFTNDNPADKKLFVDHGRTFYAAIPYNNLPDQRQIMLGWLMPFETPTDPWKGQMSIPRELLLKNTAEGVRLYQQPAVKPNGTLQTKSKVVISKELELKNPDNVYWIDATFTPGTAKRFGFKIADNTTVGYENGVLFVNDKKIKVKPSEKVRLQVLFDKSSLEVFINDGEQVYTTLLFPKEEDKRLSVFAEDGDVQLNDLKLWNLK